ncbi:Y-family DNA polymerase [Mycoplasmopsis verecunda]|uniref:DNA polymerase-4 n=1 Tax=Mycoplasmopsis verecunda TaxID=171291 RepID=A0A1T4KEQ2_9BACT|nr:DNA polymerase IV [Mycoplasmopsis verecunda]WPB54874.1 DNA polymerase IV [Mycoplasmopsis verecunda]SJZ40815.1 DNA polymerase-4 [Mycoplasmopsis verecunda]
MIKPIIFHIDFDCYFVSAARTIQPELNNKPVAISRSSSHAIAVSVSYELKNKGVKAGMKNFEIQAIEPKTTFVPSDMDLYERLSSEIFEYIAKYYTGNIQIASIDECFLDVTDLVTQRNISCIQLAHKLQRDLMHKFRIPVTIGISHNKFAAKMTTNISKPFGIGFTDENNFAEHFFNLDIEKYHGIGKKTADKLRKVNINTIGELASKKVSDLEISAIFGRIGQDILHNLDPYVYEHISFKDEQALGIGNEITFEDYSLPYEIKIEHLVALCEKVSERLIKENLAGNVITLTIRQKSKKWINKQIKIANYINSKGDIYKIAFNIFTKYFGESDFIGIGIRVSNLINLSDIYLPIELINSNKINLQDNLIKEIIAEVNTLFANPTLEILDDSTDRKQKLQQGKYKFKKMLFRK